MRSEKTTPVASIDDLCTTVASDIKKARATQNSEFYVATHDF